MTVPAKPPICFSCQRYRSWDVEHPMAFCEAFPDGIPVAIIEGGFDHRQAYSGDKGIRYLADPAEATMLALYEGKAP